MADEVVKTLITRFVTDAGDALSKGKAYRELVDSIKSKLRELMDQGLGVKEAWKGLFSEEYTQRIRSVREEIVRLKGELQSYLETQRQAGGAAKVSDIAGGNTVSATMTQDQARALQSDIIRTNAALNTQKQIYSNLRQESTAYRDAGTQAQREIAAETKNTTTAMGGMGNVAKGVLGGIIGSLGVQAFRKFVDWARQAIQAGYELSKAIFQLEVAVRALRRSGLDIATRDIYNNIDALQKKFGVFSRRELVEGSAALLNLIRDLNMTKDQILDMQDAVATLAVVNGRSMDDVQRTVALALSSGYTEGLQRLGVSINRVTIAEQAAEMGWKNGYTALTEYQRAQATYVLLMEKVLKYEEDLAEYMDTMPGLIDKNTAAWKDLTAVSGQALSPLKLVGTELLVVIGKIGVYVSSVIGGATLAFKLFGTLFDSLEVSMSRLKDLKAWGSEITKAFRDGADAAAEYVNAISIIFSSAPWEEKLKAFDEMMSGGFSENAVEGIENATDEMSEDVEQTLDDLRSDFEDILKDHARDLEDLERDFARDIDKIDRELARDLAKVDEESFDKRRDLWQEYYDDLAEIDSDYKDDVADTLWDANNKRSNIEADYREKQLQEEIRFQESMRKLREQFVLDLEDALRERDALQILRLIRRYNLERKQQQREHQANRDENKREYEREIAELAEVTQHKLDVLEREWKQRRDALKAGLLSEIEAEKEAANLKKAELIAQAEWEKEERRIRWEQQKEDEDIEFDRRITDLANKYSTEEGLTRDHIDKIIKEFERAYGSGGAVELLYKRFMEMMVNSIAMVGAAGQFATAMSWSGGENTGLPTTLPSSSWGGGENTGLPVIPPTINSVIPTTSLDTSGNVTVVISLDPSLQGEIIESTMDKVAEVLLEVQRRV